MTLSTTILGLLKGVGTDNARDYVVTSLAASLDILDGLFHATSGHTHTGAGTHGPKIPAGSLANGAATGAVLGADVATLTGAQTLTNKTLTAPTLTAPVIADFTASQHSHSTVAGGGLTRAAVLTVTAAYTATDTDELLLVDATTAAFTLTLPTAVGRGGKTFVIKKIDASANAVTVDGAGTETIDGAATLTISGAADSYTLVSDGAGWRII